MKDVCCAKRNTRVLRDLRDSRTLQVQITSDQKSLMRLRRIITLKIIFRVFSESVI